MLQNMARDGAASTGHEANRKIGPSRTRFLIFFGSEKCQAKVRTN